MSINRTLIILILIPFTILTGLALWFDGVLGIFGGILNSYGSMQIYVDLVISIALIDVWIYRDAKAQGRNPWPWIIASFIVGVFAPLIYLFTRHESG